MENNEIMENNGELTLDNSQELMLDNKTMDQLNSLAANDGEDSSDDKLTASEIAILIGAIGGGFMLLKWLVEKACKGSRWAFRKLKAPAAKLRDKKAAEQNQVNEPAPATQTAEAPVAQIQVEETKTEEEKKIEG